MAKSTAKNPAAEWPDDDGVDERGQIESPFNEIHAGSTLEELSHKKNMSNIMNTLEGNVASKGNNKEENGEQFSFEEKRQNDSELTGDRDDEEYIHISSNA